MICALIEKYGLATAYCEAGGAGSPDAVINILAGVVFFLNLHYALDVPK
jgi:hypothetical protein